MSVFSLMLNQHSSKQSQQLQCLDNKVSNNAAATRVQVSNAVADGVRPVQKELVSMKQEQAKQGATLEKHSRDIAHIFSIIGASSSSSGESLGAGSMMAQQQVSARQAAQPRRAEFPKEPQQGQSLQE